MKRAVIIGASSGIGKETALLLAANDHLVGITGRRTENLERIRESAPSHFIVKTFDISETSSCVSFLEQLIAEMGGLDLLMISAGTGDINNELDFNIEKSTIDTNISGFTIIADWTFNYFKNQGAGHLIGITSVAGLRGNRSAPSYNASKAYQINYLEGLRQKAKSLKLPIIISDIRPGYVDTDMAKGDGKFWVASPARAAKQIYKAIKQKKSVAYITKRYAVLALLLKILPRSVYSRF